MARLAHAIAGVAHALALLSDQEWDALRTEEAMIEAATLSYWNFAGTPEQPLPEILLGQRVLQAFAQKYPHLACDEPAGAA
jgi:hypothetical protein